MLRYFAVRVVLPCCNDDDDNDGADALSTMIRTAAVEVGGGFGYSLYLATASELMHWACQKNEHILRLRDCFACACFQLALALPFVTLQQPNLRE